MEGFDYFLHRHPLTLNEGKVVNNDGVVDCSGCGKGLSGPVYGCSDCKFYIHESCTQLPRQIQNFFHPCPLLLGMGFYSCNACYQDGNGLRYRCVGCDFNMHVECAQRPAIESQGEELIHHFTHWKHPLMPIVVDQKKKDLEILCTICTKKLLSVFDSSSFDTPYGCEECEFFVHKSCMLSIRQTIFNHSFHQTCPLILLTSPLYFNCDGCCDYGLGLVFRCTKCWFVLDAKCALLPTLEETTKGAYNNKIQHYTHRHPLTLCKSKDLARCRACGENICLSENPTCFCCELNDRLSCDFYLHASCAELPQEILHPFLPIQPLTLMPLPEDNIYYACSACLSSDKFLLVYRSDDRPEINIQVDCARLTPSISSKAHPHLLTFVYKTHTYYWCNLCDKRGQNFLLTCVECQFRIHIYCNPSFPKIINHKSHLLHPLVLTSSPLQVESILPEDEYNSNDEFYCDICEEKRCKFESVYYCEECKLIAETKCAASEFLPSTSALVDKSLAKFKVVPMDEENYATDDPTFAKLEELIAKHRAKAEPLEEEIEKLQARLEKLEAELEPVRSVMKELKTERARLWLNPNYKYEGRLSI